MVDYVDDSRIGYNLYEHFDSIAYNMVSHLVANNEMIWKLLFYHDRDAWKHANLTLEQKGGLIYAGQDDSSKYNVFIDDGSPDVHTREDCILRISPIVIFPENRTVGTVSVSLEVYSHYKMNTLSNYKTRVDVITTELLKTFNGVEIDGLVGKLFFDRLTSQQPRLSVIGQLPFKGKQIFMSSKSG